MSGQLTLEMVLAAQKKMLEPPNRTTYLCYSCKRGAIYHGFEHTVIGDDECNYLICDACALAKAEGGR